MRVNSVQNSQNFGMAFRLNGEGAKKLAEKFHNFSDPGIAESYFVKNFVKPVEKFKSEVIYDGKDVFVRDHLTADIYQVANKKPLVDGASVFYSVKNKAKNDMLFKVDYWTKEDVPNLKEMSSTNDMETRLNYAKEIVKEMGKKEHTVETTEETAERLNKIYG